MITARKHLKYKWNFRFSFLHRILNILSIKMIPAILGGTISIIHVYYRQEALAELLIGVRGEKSSPPPGPRARGRPPAAPSAGR